MRFKNFFVTTLRKNPAEAEIASHQLMLRAGLIQCLASGIYSWLPMGLRVVQKIETIVRKHMNQSGALEISMPVVQPSDMWQESGRWDYYGAELLRLQDRNHRDFCLGPTHEEVVTDILRKSVFSYKQLPINLYQIQTKFRDEIRPRFGIMRAREFMMKDAYSFNLDQKSLQQSYDIMYETYKNIFSEIGVDYKVVQADSGAIGGSHSHEFHVLANTGEDFIAYSDQSVFKSNFAANVEAVIFQEPASTPNKNKELAPLKEVETIGKTTITSVCNALNIDSTQTIKTLILQSENHIFAVAIRGDHTLSLAKVVKNTRFSSDITILDKTQVFTKLQIPVGCIGPIGLNIPLYVDISASVLKNFVCGANKEHLHYTGVNWNRDVGSIEIADFREAQAGDVSPDGSGNLVIVKGIEVGHIFQLGDKYSSSMNFSVLDENGLSRTPLMGCYGIGISRIVAAVIEQNHDINGIIWPESIAPFQLVIVPVNYFKNTPVREYCDLLYTQCLQQNIEVLLLDQDKARLGELLADTDLLGIPHRVVIGNRGLEEGTVEYSHRASNNKQIVNSTLFFDFIKKHLSL